MNIDFNRLDDEEKERFTENFIRISGVDDYDSPNPWCAPWVWMKRLAVEGHPATVEELAAAYYAEVKADIEAAKAEEEKHREEQ